MIVSEPAPPHVTPERRLAWVGLVVSPVLLVVLNLIHFALPGILTFGLVVAFIASFGYLVATMSPRLVSTSSAILQACSSAVSPKTMLGLTLSRSQNRVRDWKTGREAV